MGPLLFCLTLHQLSLQLRSELCLFYLDDGKLGGSEDDILHDLEAINNAADELGLVLNMQKCELITCSSMIRDSILSVSPQLQVIMPDYVSLLGSPLGDIACICDTIQLKVSNLETMGARLQHMHAHDVLQLLRHSFALPKMMHVLHTTPCFLSSGLTDYDDLVRSILSSIVNIIFQENDLIWMQATLPVKCGGLGIRSAVQLAPSAFLASAAGTSDLIRQILPPRFTGIPYSETEEALSCWSQGHSEDPPSSDAAHQQKAWDTPRVHAQVDALLEASTNDTSRAHLLAAIMEYSGAWLTAMPISSLGLRMDDDTIRTAVGLRLGTTLCHLHQCSHCGAEVDSSALHGLSCRWSEGRHSRHAAVNDLIHRALTSAKVPSRLEPSGLFLSDGKRRMVLLLFHEIMGNARYGT